MTSTPRPTRTLSTRRKVLTGIAAASACVATGAATTFAIERVADHRDDTAVATTASGGSGGSATWTDDDQSEADEYQADEYQADDDEDDDDRYEADEYEADDDGWSWEGSTSGRTWEVPSSPGGGSSSGQPNSSSGAS